MDVGITDIADRIDWWKINTTEDGKLTMNLIVNSLMGIGASSYLELYDVNGATLIASNYTSGTSPKSVSNNLRPGIYYVHVFRYPSGSPQWSYTLCSSI